MLLSQLAGQIRPTHTIEFETTNQVAFCIEICYSVPINDTNVGSYDTVTYLEECQHLEKATISYAFHIS